MASEASRVAANGGGSQELARYVRFKHCAALRNQQVDAAAWTNVASKKAQWWSAEPPLWASGDVVGCEQSCCVECGVKPALTQHSPS